jgi:hypothetical protein
MHLLVVNDNLVAGFSVLNMANEPSGDYSGGKGNYLKWILI